MQSANFAAHDLHGWRAKILAAFSEISDAESAMAFGDIMNRQGPGLLLNERGQRMVNAAYNAVGETNKGAISNG